MRGFCNIHGLALQGRRGSRVGPWIWMLAVTTAGRRFLQKTEVCGKGFMIRQRSSLSCNSFSILHALRFLLLGK